MNNQTRRTDVRNLLAVKMARAAELFRPKFIIVENVPASENDTHKSIDRLREQLTICNGGYQSMFIKLRAEQFGVAQTRHRSFIIAWSNHINGQVSESLLRASLASLSIPQQRPVEWAIGDLQDRKLKGDLFDTPPNVTDETTTRIKYLDKSGMTELPDELRPDCHRIKQHTYGSVYGRMKRGHSAPTLTTGFQTMGRGRFVHPTRPRLITPHEAARIQFLPDFFSFGTTNRAELVRAIGNAVPPKLGYVIGLALLGLTTK